MKKSDKHTENILSAASMQRYVNGEMNDAEMHEVELLMESNPFVAEAIEGLQSMPLKKSFSEDIGLMSNRLRYRTSQEKPQTKGFSFMRMAAALAVFIGLGIGLFVLLNSAPFEKQEMLAEKNELENYSTENSVLINQDSTVSSESESIDEVPPIELDAEMEEPKAQKKELDKEEERKTQLAEAKKEVESDADLVESLGAEEIPSFADIPSEEKDEIALNSQPMIQATSTENNFMSKSKTGIAPPDFTPSEPMPENGFDAFNDYIKRELVYPKAAKKEKIKGKVQLSFVVGELGEIKSIQIEKSLGYGCDEEAIRLLKNGPKWIPSMVESKVVVQRTKIEIAFTP